MGVSTEKVKDADDGMRLNRWFLKYYPGLSLGRFQKLLRTKQIKVDGRKAEASLKLAAGQEIRIPPLDEEKSTGKKEEGVSAKDAGFITSLVIYKDDNILVLNKPSGLAVQGGTKTTRHVDGMLDALKFGLDERPRLVHRIDKNTSGLLVLARTRKYADMLTKAFREHQLPKTYLALVIGCPGKIEGVIDAPLEKEGEKVRVCAGGKKAVTTYRVLDRTGEKFALVEACPRTGRTHQIRAHMEYLGTPIAGDDKYFGPERRRFSTIADKLHLHAYKIDLSVIYNRKKIITAPVPEYFKQSLEAVGMEFKEQK